MTDFNDTIGAMLREQIQTYVRRERIVEEFFNQTSAEPVLLGHRRNDLFNNGHGRRDNGLLYEVGDYSLGVYTDNTEIRFVLFAIGGYDYQPLQTASGDWFETIGEPHPITLREADFNHFGLGEPFDVFGSDDERGAAVMKLMMLNKAEAA